MIRLKTSLSFHCFEKKSSIYVNSLLNSEFDGFEKKNKQMKRKSKFVHIQITLNYLFKQAGWSELNFIDKICPPCKKCPTSGAKT